MSAKRTLPLGYHPKWLEYGFISEAWLSDQASFYAQSDDKHTEHYRYAAFRSVLKTRSILRRDEFAHYLELAGLDENDGMAGAALQDLVEWRGLTEEQFAVICTHPLYANAGLGRVLDRERRTRGEK